MCRSQESQRPGLEGPSGNKTAGVSTGEGVSQDMLPDKGVGRTWPRARSEAAGTKPAAAMKTGPTSWPGHGQWEGRGNDWRKQIQSKFQGPQVCWALCRQAAEMGTHPGYCNLPNGYQPAEYYTCPGTCLHISMSISFTCPRRRHPHLPERKQG